MNTSRWILILSIAALLLLEVALVWRPFDSRAVLYTTPWRANHAAGELVDGFRIEQTVPPGLVRTRKPMKKSVHWHGLHSLKPTLQPNCFSLRFATYVRRNSGDIRVDWEQGDSAQSWRLAASNLVDNDYVDFCPNTGVALDREARISVEGAGAVSGSAATVWLTRSKLKPALVDGRSIGKRGLALQLVYHDRVSIGDIANVGNGAFLIACLASMAIALIALFSVMRELAGRGMPMPATDA